MAIRKYNKNNPFIVRRTKTKFNGPSYKVFSQVNNSFGLQKQYSPLRKPEERYLKNLGQIKLTRDISQNIVDSLKSQSKIVFGKGVSRTQLIKGLKASNNSVKTILVAAARKGHIADFSFKNPNENVITPLDGFDSKILINRNKGKGLNLSLLNNQNKLLASRIGLKDTTITGGIDVLKEQYYRDKKIATDRNEKRLEKSIKKLEKLNNSLTKKHSKEYLRKTKSKIRSLEKTIIRQKAEKIKLKEAIVGDIAEKAANEFLGKTNKFYDDNFADNKDINIFIANGFDPHDIQDSERLGEYVRSSSDSLAYKAFGDWINIAKNPERYNDQVRRAVDVNNKLVDKFNKRRLQRLYKK